MTSDASDLSAALAGDPDACRRLYERHAGLVLSVCRRGSSWTDAEDALQETFLRAFRKLDQLGRPEQLRGWLCAIARRVCSERRRVANRRHRHEELAIMARTAANPVAESSAAGAERAEQLERLTAALNRLPARERLAIHLYYLEPDPLKTAPNIMGCSRSGFHRLLARAREHLAQALREERAI